MMSSIKKTIFTAAQLPGLHFMMRKVKQGPKVLFYHGVEERLTDPRIQTLHLPLYQFEKQMRYLKNNFEIITLDNLYESLSNGYGLTPTQVIITFDDGYKNNLEIVAPYCIAHDIPFSIFVSTKHISEAIRFPTYYLRTAVFFHNQDHIEILGETYDISTEANKLATIGLLSKRLKISSQAVTNQIIDALTSLLSKDQWKELNHLFSSDGPMTWSEVKQLFDQGVSIGSHTHNHCILHERQKLEDIDNELTLSKTLIQNYLGKCDYFAYPNGGMNDVSPKSFQFLESNEYRLGFTTIPGELDSECNPFILPRIPPPADLNHFKFVINTSSRLNKNYREWSKF